MEDTESDHFHDDLEVHISDIDSDKPANDGTDQLPTPTRPLAHWPLLSRSRKLQLTITAGIVVLTILLLLESIPSVRNLATGVFLGRRPIDVTPLAPGADLFYIQANPPWGHLTIDGQPITHLPVIGVDVPMHIARGTHELAWRADPFFTRHCTLSVPSNYVTDTCSHTETVELKSGLYASVISFWESLNELPASQRAGLIQATRLALSAQQSSDIVQPGEFYVLASTDPHCKPSFPSGEPRCYASAQQPLKATLSLQLDTEGLTGEKCVGPEQGCTLQSIDCHLFCPAITDRVAARSAWQVFAVVLPDWQYATLQGGILARHIPNNSLWDFANNQSADETFIGLNITWDVHGWHVVIPGGTTIQNSDIVNPVCFTADILLQLFPSPIAANNTSLNTSWQDVGSPIRARGCVVVAFIQQSSESAATPSSAPPLVAYCLHRFGLLLAANDVAHHFWPTMPMADAYEQHLARQIATSEGGVIQAT